MEIKQGDKVPDFKLKDQDGVTCTFEDYKGRWILLYFYPKDDTPGCTIEACSFRDHFFEFQENGIEVVGVSVDDAASHQKFIEKFDLPFTLLTDLDKKIVKQFGIWGKKEFMGREYMGTNRTSFLIDPWGEVVKVYRDVNPDLHIQEILADFEELEKTKMKI